MSQKYICLIPFTVSCQKNLKTNPRPQIKQESLAVIHVCIISTLNFFLFYKFRVSDIKIGQLTMKTLTPSSLLQLPDSSCTTGALLYTLPLLVFPSCKTSSPHESLLSQSHLIWIQIPKIDVNTVNSPLSLGTLPKLRINWHTELALGRVTLSSVANVQHCSAIPSPGQL